MGSSGITHENPKGQKYLIGGIEKTVESFEAVLLPKVPHIFKELFEEDVLEEEVILELAKKSVSKELAQKIHDKAAPFIKWLQEAEEETSESDGELEIEYDDRAKISKLKEVSDQPATNDVNENVKKEEVSEDEDEVDIDDI